MRLTVMTEEEIIATNRKIEELKEKYFNAIDNLDFKYASELDKEIVRLNNSIR